MVNALILDIETCPIDIEKASNLEEEEALKLINPIDSKIVAIGVRYKDEDFIFQSDNEKEMLEQFWAKWKEIRGNSVLIPVVGFNIVAFDMPFLVSRSFINKVPVVPFTLKELVDLKEKLSAYRYGKTRGKLKEYAQLIGMDISDTDGSMVMDLYKDGKHDEIKKYLIKDLEITEGVYKLAEELNITKINRW